MKHEEFIKNLKKAAYRIEEFDKVDGCKNRDLLTILTAMIAGVKEPSCKAQYDAIVMLWDWIRFSNEAFANMDLMEYVEQIEGYNDGTEKN